jgi:hypothetical protein
LQLVTNPLEKCLGAHQLGTYDQNKEGKDYAFVHIEELWQDDIDEGSDNEDETKEEPNIVIKAITTLEP